MSPHMRVHAAAAGLLLLLCGIVLLFWSYPRLLIFILLAVVAALAYGALYLVLSSWMNPALERRNAPTSPPPKNEAPQRADPSFPTQPTAADKAWPPKKETGKVKTPAPPKEASSHQQDIAHENENENEPTQNHRS